MSSVVATRRSSRLISKPKLVTPIANPEPRSKKGKKPVSDSESAPEAESELSELSAVEELKKSPKKRARKTVAEPVYAIPDVEKKETTFRGRLGKANRAIATFY